MPAKYLNDANGRRVGIHDRVTLNPNCVERRRSGIACGDVITVGRKFLHVKGQYTDKVVTVLPENVKLARG